MSFVAITQIFKPPGINNVAGTPNFLLQIDNFTQKVVFTDVQIGGITDASFSCFNPFETIVDIQAGNLVVHACFGGYLHTNVSSGSNSIVVDSLTNSGDGNTFNDIIVGDYVLISDGVNTDLMKVVSVTGSGPTWTLGLGADGALQNTTTLLNSYSVAAGTKVARLLYQGKIRSRSRTTNLNAQFVISCYGVCSRYSDVIDDANIVLQDGCTSILEIAQSYSTTLPEIIVNSANFAPASGYLVTEVTTEQDVLSTFKDIITQENGQAAGTIYTLWCDILNQIWHGKINTNNAAPDWTLDLLTANTYGDILGDLIVTDQDLTTLVNAAIVYGGTDSTGTPIKIAAYDQDSVTTYGWYEGVFSNNPGLTTQDQAAQYAAGQFQIAGFPVTNASLKLTQASCRINTRQLIKITGFTDSSVLYFNVLTAKYTIDAAKQMAVCDLTLGQAKPDIAAVMAEIAGEQSIRSLDSQGSNLVNNFVVSGFDITYSGSSLSITISSGVIYYNNVQYTVPAQTITLSANTRYVYGAQATGTPPIGVTLPATVEMPHILGNSKMYGTNTYMVSSGALSKVSNFNGVALYGIRTNGTGVIGVKDKRYSGGIGNKNLKPATAATPTATLGSISAVAEGPASAAVTFVATVASMTFDDTIFSIDVSWAIAGGTAYQPSVPISYQPTTGAVSGTIHGLGANQAYDLYLIPRGQNGQALGTILVGTSPTISASLVTAAIATWNQFGGTLQSDGTFSNADGHSSTTTYSFISGQPFTVQMDIAKGATGQSSTLLLGNTTNGYGVTFNASGVVRLIKYVAGVQSTIGASVTLTNDTKLHTFRLTVIPGATNSIQGSMDGTDPNNGPVTDASLNLTSGTWPVTIATGGSMGKIANYAPGATPQHHGNMSVPVQAIINSSSQALITDFPGGTLNTDGTLTNVDGATSHITAAWQVLNVVTAKVLTAKTNTSGTIGIIVGDTTNGYGLGIDSTGHAFLRKYVAGVATDLISTFLVSNDTHPHSFMISVQIRGTSGSYVNYIEYSLDGFNGAIARDPSGQPALANPIPATLYSGATQSVYDFDLRTGVINYLTLPNLFQNEFVCDGVVTPFSIRYSNILETFIPAVAPYIPDLQLHWSMGSSANLTYWLDSYDSPGSDAKIYFGSANQINMGHTTSGSPQGTVTCATSDLVYFIVTWQVATSSFQIVTKLNSPFKIVDLLTYSLIDGYIPILGYTDSTIVAGNGHPSVSGIIRANGGLAGKSFKF